jgi:hypothetical protein
MYEVRYESVCVGVFKDTSGGLLYEVRRLGHGLAEEVRQAIVFWVGHSGRRLEDYHDQVTVDCMYPRKSGSLRLLFKRLFTRFVFYVTSLNDNHRCERYYAHVDRLRLPS